MSFMDIVLVIFGLGTIWCLIGISGSLHRIASAIPFAWPEHPPEEVPIGWTVLEPGELVMVRGTNPATGLDVVQQFVVEGVYADGSLRFGAAADAEEQQAVA